MLGVEVVHYSTSGVVGAGVEAAGAAGDVVIGVRVEVGEMEEEDVSCSVDVASANGPKTNSSAVQEREAADVLAGDDSASANGDVTVDVAGVENVENGNETAGGCHKHVEAAGAAEERDEAPSVEDDAGAVAVGGVGSYNHSCSYLVVGDDTCIFRRRTSY